MRYNFVAPAGIQTPCGPTHSKVAILSTLAGIHIIFMGYINS